MAGWVHTELDAIRDPGFRTYAEPYFRKEKRLFDALNAEGLSIGPDRTQETTALFQSLPAEVIRRCNDGRSFHLNERSPACLHCQTAQGATTFILTLACNRDCFFCTNRNQHNYAELSQHLNNVTEAFNHFLAAEGRVRSVALTGGEPLLFPENCTEFFRHVRQVSPRTHTRLYTNGDLMTEEVLTPLKPVLDELRIGIKAEDDGSFNLSRIARTLSLAKRFIPQVTVEMPVLPDSFNTMKPLLDLLNQAQIFSVNLLEYLFPWQKAADYAARGFKVKHRPYRVLYNYTYAGGVPVDGSELEALRCVRYAYENDFSIGVHYCSLENKLTSQIFQQNHHVPAGPTEIQSLKDYFFKSIKLFGADGCKAYARMLDEGSGRFQWNETDQVLELHPEELLHLVDAGLTEAAVTYAVVEQDGCQKLVREVHLEHFDLQNRHPKEILESL